MASASVEPGHRVSVVLVDDDPDIRAMYGGRLRADGYDVTLAADGCQALTAVSGATALILLDVRMPGIDGVTVLGRLKKDASIADVPVVMLSNESDPTTMATCSGMGAIGWWSKSALVPAELTRRVRDLLGPRRPPIDS